MHDSTYFEVNKQHSRCFAYANIKEEGIGITVTLCADDVRKRHVYTSSTNTVEIRAIIDGGEDASRFIFDFEGFLSVDRYVIYKQINMAKFI